METEGRKRFDLNILLEGRVPNGSDYAIVAFADDQSETVRSLSCPVFKCSGVVPKHEAKLSRDFIQKQSPSLAKLCLRRTNRWFRLPLNPNLDDDVDSTDLVEDNVQEVLDKFVEESENHQKRIERDRATRQSQNTFQKDESTSTEEVLEEEDTKGDVVSKETAVKEITEPAKEEEEVKKSDETLLAEEFERELSEMILSDTVRKLDVEVAVDKLRPGTAKKQSWYVIYHIECESGGGAVAILAGFESETDAADYCVHKNVELPFVNVTYGPIGQFMPMPPGDFSANRVHADPRVEEMKARMKTSTMKLM